MMSATDLLRDSLCRIPFHTIGVPEMPSHFCVYAEAKLRILGKLHGATSSGEPRRV